MKILFGIAVVAAVGLVLFFAFNSYVYEKKQSDVAAEAATTTNAENGGEEEMLYDLGTYDYRCAEGSEFSISLPSDMSSLLLTPASDIERVPQAVLVKEESEAGVRYAGASLTFEAKGETITLSTATWETICIPLTRAGEAPFNFGE